MKKAEVKRLFADDIFQAKLGRVNSMESLQTLLANYGVKMTLDQMETAIKKGSSEELTQEDLKALAQKHHVRLDEYGYVMTAEDEALEREFQREEEEARREEELLEQEQAAREKEEFILARWLIAISRKRRRERRKKRRNG